MSRFSRSQYFVPIICGLVIVFLFAFLKVSSNQSIQYLRQRMAHFSYDAKVRLLPRQKQLASPQVVILDIDEQSLKAYGRWPWSRQLLAKIIDRLWLNHVAVVGSDIVFSEPQMNPIDSVLKLNYAKAIKDQIRSKRSEMDYDQSLAISLKKGESILPYVFFKKQHYTKGILPAPLLTPSSLGSQHNLVTSMQGYLSCLPMLVKRSVDSGFISYFRDQDGVTRKLPLLLKYRHHIYYSFALAVAKTYLLVKNISVVWDKVNNQYFVSGLKLDRAFIPTDMRGEVYIPFYGARSAFTSISVVDFLKGQYDPHLLNGKIVLIGASAIGLTDLQATPIYPTIPGVELQANVIQGLIDNQFVYRPFWLRGFELISLILLGVLLSILLPWLSSKRQGLLCFFVLFVLLGLDAMSWSSLAWVAHVAIIWFMVLFLGLFNFLYGFIFTQSHERLLKAAFSRYIPCSQVKLISKNPTHFNLEGEEREMTVLFSDIRNFSAIAESLSASEVKKLLNEFFTPMTKAVFDAQGTIDKYVGDMIVAFWGAPLENKNHANDTISAALSMMQVQRKLSKAFFEKGLPSFKMGIGINSGLMNVGDMGSEYRQNYTVIGDNVNLGSRLESITKYYGVDCLVSEFTHDLQTDYYCRRLDKVKVKGRDEGIFIFEPLCLLQEVTKEDQRVTELLYQAQDHYYQQQWDAALNAFTELENEGFNAVVCSIYQQRIQQFKQQPPLAGWDGSFKFNFK